METKKQSKELFIFFILIILVIAGYFGYKNYWPKLQTEQKRPTKIPPVNKYTCPANGWVDCMPGPDAKPECSSEAMLWYQTNCPNFQGGAL